MNESLENVEVGDKVILRTGRWDSTIRITRVDRLTKTQLCVGGYKFYKKSGREVGGSGAWSNTWIEIGTEEKLEEARQQIKKGNLCKSLSNEQKPLTVSGLRQAYDLEQLVEMKIKQDEFNALFTNP